ncbi:sirohydrochlorin chelatase [Candidatus Palauibacter sp.]|uniref:sirohydrochlorin chelatase n=1 Tax=Candidatus Palauibacter sp. TaxID=3101350 RepID=UPI003B02290C
MAHGGGPEWDGRVSAALKPLRDRVPVALALGMADPGTLQAALDSLAERHVTNIAVVRLFVSGAAFLHPTEFLFGLRPDPPRRAMVGHRMVDGSELDRLETSGRILLTQEGLAGSGEVSGILLDRAGSAGPHPPETGVLLIAHGMSLEAENQDLLEAMNEGARTLRSAGYAEVRVAALREDWAGPRAQAEREIRAAVTAMAEQGRSVVVIPYRVSGFGPYAEVLDGLEYVATEGFLSHDLVTQWIADRATAAFCSAGLTSPLATCGKATAEPGDRPFP